jgi:hypothetical protein
MNDERAAEVVARQRKSNASTAEPALRADINLQSIIERLGALSAELRMETAT